MDEDADFVFFIGLLLTCGIAALSIVLYWMYLHFGGTVEVLLLLVKAVLVNVVAVTIVFCVGYTALVIPGRIRRWL